MRWLLVSIARRMSQTSGNRMRTETLKQVEAVLETARLDGEFFLFPIKTNAQRDWVVSNRGPEAEHWGIVATLKPEHIDYESWLDETVDEPWMALDRNIATQERNVATSQRSFNSSSNR